MTNTAGNPTQREALQRKANRQDLTLSRLLEQAVDEKLHTERARRWRQENREQNQGALKADNERVGRDGLLSDAFRPL